MNQHAARGKCRRLGGVEHYGKYQARISRNKERLYLGQFDTIEEAAAAIREHDEGHGYVIGDGT